MERRYPPREQRTSRRILAENLRLIRLRRRIPQDELADLVGLDRSYLGDVERGARNIAVDNLDKIAAALGVSVAQLLTEPDTSGVAGHLMEDIRSRIREEGGVYLTAGTRLEERGARECGRSAPSVFEQPVLVRCHTVSRSREDAPT